VIEGYASAASVNRGGQIGLFVNTSAPSYTMDVYRLGYYGGLGARRMLPTITRSASTQPGCPQDPATGLIECNWGNPYVLNIPNSSDPTDWMSGIYVVKLTASTGPQQYIQFAVRDDARFTDVLMQQAVATYQAYNVWGGKSLYGTIANRVDTANKAEKVSFNRPYDGDQGNGVADLFTWEYPMLFWLEKEGYDVSYATSVDVDADPNLLISHKVFMSVGHDEYWSSNMRDNVEGARDRGVNLAFFSGNTSYWQVRFEPSLVTGDLGRTMVGYKEHWRQDPITPDKFKTTTSVIRVASSGRRGFTCRSRYSVNCFRRDKFWVFSRICGSFPAPVADPTCGTGRFPGTDTSESRTPFSWLVSLCC
jgi:hypothetical protein